MGRANSSSSVYSNCLMTTWLTFLKKPSFPAIHTQSGVISKKVAISKSSVYSRGLINRIFYGMPVPPIKSPMLIKHLYFRLAYLVIQSKGLKLRRFAYIHTDITCNSLRNPSFPSFDSGPVFQALTLILYNTFLMLPSKNG